MPQGGRRCLQHMHGFLDRVGGAAVVAVGLLEHRRDRIGLSLHCRQPAIGERGSGAAALAANVHYVPEIGLRVAFPDSASAIIPLSLGWAVLEAQDALQSLL
jgi:hypothetical protein